MSNKLQELKKLRQQRLTSQSGDSSQQKRNVLYRAVETYGYDAVMVASGWKQSTISQYLRNPNSTISSENLKLTIELLKEVYGN